VPHQAVDARQRCNDNVPTLSVGLTGGGIFACAGFAAKLTSSWTPSASAEARDLAGTRAYQRR
jgi:hypothetical protein